MENSEEFKRMVASIIQLEQQLLSIQEGTMMNEKYGVEAEEEIESYFARCEQALAARKVTLMRELAEQLINQKKAAADAQEEVNKAIKARKKILKAGSYVYASNIKVAEHVWKEATNLQPPQSSVAKIQVVLSSSSFELIRAFGTVVLNSLQNLETTLENTGESAAKDRNQRSESDYSVAKKITTLAGSTSGFEDGDGEMAKFKYPTGICWNPQDKCLYLCDSGNTGIRKISLQGQVNTLASNELLSGPVGIAMHYRTNTLFVTNSDSHSICKITASGLMSIHAGSGQLGRRDGLGNARFNSPFGIAIDQRTDTIYVCDFNAIRKITLQGEVSTLSGSTEGGDVDGTGKAVRFNRLAGIYFDERLQSLFVCDLLNHKVKRVSLEDVGDVSTLCRIQHPQFVVVANNIILVSTAGGKIFRVTEAGEVSVLQQHEEGGKRQAYRFINPSGMALDETSNTCYVADYGDHVIKKISF